MQTCPASMAYDNQRIRDLVDDAEMLLMMQWNYALPRRWWWDGWVGRRSQHSRLPDTGDPRSKPRLSPQPTRVCARHHRWCCLELRYSVINLRGSWRWGVLVGRGSFSSGWRWSHTHSRLEQQTVSPVIEDWWSSHILRSHRSLLHCSRGHLEVVLLDVSWVHLAIEMRSYESLEVPINHAPVVALVHKCFI